MMQHTVLTVVRCLVCNSCICH